MMTGRTTVQAIAGLLVAFGFVVFAPPTAAQTIVNPTTVEFNPSPDHTSAIEGTPVVDRYEMEIFVQGVAQPLVTLNLGKPSPGGDGKIRVNFVALLQNPLTPGTIFTGLVSAAGPGGRASSAMAPDTFSFSVPCTYSASPTNPAALAAAGGGASITITAPAGCAWTASEAASWLSITGGASGTGNGTVSYTVTANTATSPRSATLTAAGQTITITQDAAPCTFSVSPLNPASLVAGGGTASVTVTAPDGCAWTASEATSWLSITSGASGTGNGTVSYTATANTATSSRNATLTVAGHTVTVTQDAAPCSFVVTPTNPTIVPAGGSAVITVTTTGGCAWTSSESASWLSITGGGNGNSSGTVSITATGNTTAAARTATITVAGQSVTVTQPAAVPRAPTNVRITGGS